MTAFYITALMAVVAIMTEFVLLYKLFTFRPSKPNDEDDEEPQPLPPEPDDSDAEKMNEKFMKMIEDLKQNAKLVEYRTSDGCVDNNAGC